MTETWNGQAVDRLLAYATDLELEVDRLRQQREYAERATATAIARILRPAQAEADPTAFRVMAETVARELSEVVKDLHDSRGYHPAHDQVVAVAIRPLAEQAFRWQQRLTASGGMELRLDLQPDHIEWFPARLRHILDNMFAHALRHSVPRGEQKSWVTLGVRTVSEGYELRLADNGAGVPGGTDRRMHNLFYPPAWVRSAELGAGLAVVRRLVEQSGGTFSLGPNRETGNEFVVTLPRYDLLDYLD